MKKLSTIQEMIIENITVGKISGAPANNQSLKLPFSKIIFLATLLKKTASELKKNESNSWFIFKSCWRNFVRIKK